MRAMDERYFALIGIRSELASARNRVAELEELEVRYATAPATIIAAPMLTPDAAPRLSPETRAKMSAAAKKRWAGRKADRRTKK